MVHTVLNKERKREESFRVIMKWSMRQQCLQELSKRTEVATMAERSKTLDSESREPGSIPFSDLLVGILPTAHAEEYTVCVCTNQVHELGCAFRVRTVARYLDSTCVPACGPFDRGMSYASLITS